MILIANNDDTKMALECSCTIILILEKTRKLQQWSQILKVQAGIAAPLEFYCRVVLGKDNEPLWTHCPRSLKTRHQFPFNASCIFFNKKGVFSQVDEEMNQSDVEVLCFATVLFKWCLNSWSQIYLHFHVKKENIIVFYMGNSFPNYLAPLSAT